MTANEHDIIKASLTPDVACFMELLFPEQWQPIAARILESGVEFSNGLCEWAPRWSAIPWTQKKGRTPLEAALKTCLYRAHDCFHQLWGLPIPTHEFTESDYYLFKRAQMCGEVAVLTISEFFLGMHLYEQYKHNEEIRQCLIRRCAVPMMLGPLKDKDMKTIAMRLDTILHKKQRPKWLRDDSHSSMFADYYVPMLEDDRRGVDHNWNIMKQEGWIPVSAPNSRYHRDLDGLELTLWMIEDFQHLLKTDIHADNSLATFNLNRRRWIVFPIGWGMHEKTA